MPQIRDFREVSFSQQNVEMCGKFLSRQTYWKLYIIENTLRIIINSVLTVQYHEKGGEWWSDLAGGEAKKNAERNIKRYLTTEAKFFSVPGNHPIYFVDIKDFSSIIRENSNLFIDVLGEKSYNKILVEIENIIIPRNIVAHMNFPTKTDRHRIDTFAQDINVYLEFLNKKDIEIKIPK